MDQQADHLLLLEGALSTLRGCGLAEGDITSAWVPGAFEVGVAAEGIGRVSLDTGVPAIFGVLTVENVEQATVGTGGKEGHKGEESARTAIEMANLRRLLRT